MEHGQGAEKTSAREGPCRCEPRDDGRGVPSGAGCARCGNPAGEARRGADAGVAEGSGQRGHLGPDEIIPKPPQNSVSDPSATNPRGAAPARTRLPEGSDEVPEAPDDDPALTGPLGLRNDAEADEAFLRGVMDKLAGVGGRDGKGHGSGD